MTQFKLDKDRRFIKRMAISEPQNKSGISIGIRQAYVLPTQKGLYYVITLAVMFVWSVNYALSLGYGITFLTAVFSLVIAVLTVQNLTAIKVFALPNKAFFAGEYAYFKLRIQSLDKQPKIRLVARRNGAYSRHDSVTLGHDIVYKIPFINASRGVHPLDYVQLSSDYPIGLFYAWTWLRFTETVMIYPQPKGDLDLPFILHEKGNTEISQHIQGVEDFIGLREYQAGDSIRQIAWKKIGQGKLVLKEFNDPAGQECVLNYEDDVLSLLENEARLSQLCQWVLMAEASGLSYELRLPNKTIMMGAGQLHKLACLEALACF